MMPSILNKNFDNNYKLNKKGEYTKQKSLENKTMSDEERQKFIIC